MELSSGADEKVKSMHSMMIAVIKRLRSLESRLSTAQTSAENKIKAISDLEDQKATLELKLGRLENLCRTLSQQKKEMDQRSKQMVEEEAVKREELSKKFETSLGDISVQIEAQSESRKAQIEENEDLRQKLGSLIEQFKVKDEQFKHQLHAEDLKRQLIEAQHAQKMGEIGVELQKTKLYQEQVQLLTKSEKQSREQLELYVQKFDSFGETLSESNKAFVKLKAELDGKTKLNRKVEAEKRNLKIQSDKILKQKNTLETLCNALKTDRAKHTKELANLRTKVAALEKEKKAWQGGSAQ
jgi:chromosome segregation ATPase